MNWDFPYAAVPNAAADDDGEACDVVVATSTHFDISILTSALAPLLEEIDARTLLDRAPLHWTRVRSRTAVKRATIHAALVEAGIAVRYVASARRSSMAVGPALRFKSAEKARAASWKRNQALPAQDDPRTDGRWFLRESGVAVDRAICGTGAGSRLAVIDDDTADAENLDVDAIVPVGLDALPRSASHGALMVAWATRSRMFRGVAPDASARLYCIPKPGIEVVWLALAVARAVFDGADVIVCATYVEGSTSPMLDDAFAVACALGRRGRGTACVFPTGREASSANGSVHSSWSLALGDPASDSRVFCIGPCARDGGWFLWSDRRGKLRPFANRGPAVRWLAPGDDIAYPFGDRERLFHAESSGASAIAAGVLLLVLSVNPSLRLRELDALVTRTLDALDPGAEAKRTPLADAFDVLPLARDADGHNAKLGYGRMHGARACAAARDPVALSLLAMGEDAPHVPHVKLPCSRRLARWTVRALLADAPASHALRALLRHGRLVAAHPKRHTTHGDGALARQGIVFVRMLQRSTVRSSRAVARELAEIAMRIERDPRAFEEQLLSAFAMMWPPRASRARQAVSDKARDKERDKSGDSGDADSHRR